MKKSKIVVSAGLLSRAVLLGCVRNELLKEAAAFDSLVSQLQDAYTRAWDEQSKIAIVEALDRLRETRNKPYDQDLVDGIMAALESRIGAEAMQAALHGPVITLTGMLYRLGAAEAGKAAGVDIVFNLPDLNALAVIEKGNLFWIGQHWNSFTHERFYEILTDYFKEGMTREQMAKRMAEDFAALGERGAAYWDLLADHAATKTREIGRITGYETAGVEYLRVRAHIDDNTTPICRKLHNRRIPLSRAIRQKDDYLDAIARMDGEAAKQEWPMLGKQDAENIGDGDLVPENIGMPPYHFRCRTITVVDFD